MWLDGSSTAAREFIRSHTDLLGNVTGRPGPRLVVFLEEQNLLMNRLRAYWAERVAEDGRCRRRTCGRSCPPVSPAIRGFENASYAGRELKVHLVFVAQRFTAEAAGGGSQGRVGADEHGYPDARRLRRRHVEDAGREGDRDAGVV